MSSKGVLENLREKKKIRERKSNTNQNIRALERNKFQESLNHLSPEYCVITVVDFTE